MRFVGEYINFNKSGIYKILNIVTGDFYIGSAICFRTRYNSHISKINSGKHHNKHLINSYLKHGSDNFEFSILELCEKDVLYIREQFFIDQLLPKYNKQKKAGEWRGHSNNGTGGFKKGVVHSKESMAKRSRAATIRKSQGLQNIRGPHSEITKSRMRQSHLDNLPSNTKLNPLIVLTIRTRIKEGILFKDIANEFGVSATTISHINCGKKWNNVQNSLTL